MTDWLSKGLGSQLCGFNEACGPCSFCYGDSAHLFCTECCTPGTAVDNLTCKVSFIIARTVEMALNLLTRNSSLRYNVGPKFLIWTIPLFAFTKKGRKIQIDICCPIVCLFVCLFSWRYNPLWLYFHSPVAGFSLLVFENSWSHTTTRHNQ
jgi:hypothetical protein